MAERRETKAAYQAGRTGLPEPRAGKVDQGDSDHLATFQGAERAWGRRPADRAGIGVQGVAPLDADKRAVTPLGFGSIVLRDGADQPGGVEPRQGWISVDPGSCRRFFFVRDRCERVGL